jgi:hypothetical protein
MRNLWLTTSIWTLCFGIELFWTFPYRMCHPLQRTLAIWFYPCSTGSKEIRDNYIFVALYSWRIKFSLQLVILYNRWRMRDSLDEAWGRSRGWRRDRIQIRRKDGFQSSQFHVQHVLLRFRQTNWFASVLDAGTPTANLASACMSALIWGNSAQ